MVMGSLKQEHLMKVMDFAKMKQWTMQMGLEIVKQKVMQLENYQQKEKDLKKPEKEKLEKRSAAFGCCTPHSSTHMDRDNYTLLLPTRHFGKNNISPQQMTHCMYRFLFPHLLRALRHTNNMPPHDLSP